MGFLNQKHETPQHYKPLSKKGQKFLFYIVVGLIIFVFLYILSFYVI
jgi:hypothetical protein